MFIADERRADAIGVAMAAATVATGGQAVLDAGDARVALTARTTALMTTTMINKVVMVMMVVVVAAAAAAGNATA